MKQKRTFPYAVITPKQEKTVRLGHPWVYEDEIIEQSEGIADGEVTDVFSAKGKYLGSGLYSGASKIRIRILDRNANETFQDSFFERRVRYALDYRYAVMDETGSMRLIHGESDGLCGLTVDKYEDILVTEVLSFGMDQRRHIIYRALIQELSGHGVCVRGIYERNESPLRLKEGLPQQKGWYDFGQPFPESTRQIISENGIFYEIDVENGQKTGFFLDQKYNRRTLRTLARGRRVLDTCTHIGSFALNAARDGASHVTAADISASAIACAKSNAVRNHLEDRMDFVVSDVFDLLESLGQGGKRYDVIVLDPPAFTKSRRTAASARAGYQRINRLAMAALPRGGYLLTASCSHFMPRAAFEGMLMDAADEAGVGLRIVERRGAAMDHPVNPAIPETEYLKFYVLQIL